MEAVGGTVGGRRQCAASGADALEHGAASRDLVSGRFRKVRSSTGTLVSRLTVEDQMVVPGPGMSPSKWHVAQTSWFIEKWVLERYAPGYRAFDDRFAYMFGAAAEPSETCLAAADRGLLSRPSHQELERYRDHVNAATLRLIAEVAPQHWPLCERSIAGALSNERSRQEAILADIKHAFWRNPVRPAYQAPSPTPLEAAPGLGWLEQEGGRHRIGSDGPSSHPAWEAPRHAVLLRPWRIATRASTNGEYLEFMDDGGYGEPRWWTPEGWATLHRARWNAPLYWEKRGGVWHQFTLSGPRLLDQEEPVCHLSWFEADAFARWSGKRLPTEAEWEATAERLDPGGNLLEAGRLHPAVADGRRPWQFHGDVWEWTASVLAPYPGAPRSAADREGAMPSGRYVVRGGSALTPAEAVHATVRSGLAPDDRTRMTGVRLAEDA